jgi:hypothetical protein
MSIEERGKEIERRVQKKITEYENTPQPGKLFGETCMGAAERIVKEEGLFDAGWEYRLHPTTSGILFVITGYKGPDNEDADLGAAFDPEFGDR